MPYMGGIELAKALLQTRPDIQVLFTSGMLQQDALNRAGGLIRVEFLAKPLRVTGFADKVRAIAAAIGFLANSYGRVSTGVKSRLKIYSGRS